MAEIAARTAPEVLPLRARWRKWRNGLIADPKFQRWAAGSPLTRMIARRKARALFDLCAGFVYSQILHACVELDLFTMLAKGPRSVAAIAASTRLPADAALRLLKAAASLKLLRALPGDRYELDDLGAAMVANPSISAFVAHHGLLYDDLRDPVALLRGDVKTEMSQFWPYAEDRPGTSAYEDAVDARYVAYSALMARSQALVAEDILEAYPLNGHSRLLDVGGGEGAFAAAAAARAPGLAITVFDLAPVVACARRRLTEAGLTARVDLVAGSFLSDALPFGADVISLVRVLHDHDDESVLALLARVHAALPSGGSVLIAEPMAGARGAEPIGDAYFGFYLLAMGRGRARTPAELTRLLQISGFSSVRSLKTRRPILTSAIIARRV